MTKNAIVIYCHPMTGNDWWLLQNPLSQARPDLQLITVATALFEILRGKLQ